MPTLLSTQQVSIEWSDLAKWQQIRQPRSARKRSSGVHLSGILDYAIVQSGLMTKQEIDQDEMPLRMAVGMAWENWVVGLYPDMVWQPGEWESGGVYGTPDGISHAEHFLLPDEKPEVVVEEFKCTWYSMNRWKNILDAKRYIWQLCANCKALNTTYARLHVLWVNGDYKPPQPIYRTYLIQFSQPEINTFWVNVITRNKDKAKAEVHE